MLSRLWILLPTVVSLTACRSAEVASEAARPDVGADLSSADVSDGDINAGDGAAESDVVVETGDVASDIDAADAFDGAICRSLAPAACASSGCQKIRCRRIDRPRACKESTLKTLGCRSKGPVLTGFDCFVEIAT